MIKTKGDLKLYLAQDKKANKFQGSNGFRSFFFPDHIELFLVALRKSEYYSTKNNLFGKIWYIYHKIRLRNYALKLGYSIPEHVFGPGLALPHYGTIVVNAHAKVGANCRIHACTNIGASGGSNKAPQIGDNVYIGPGAKIYGDIHLASNIAIAANAAVNKSITEEGVVVGGIPAKVISKIDIKKIIKHL